MNRRFLIKVLCWAIFAAGILVQFLAPNLEIVDRKFVIRVNPSPSATVVNDPQAIVNKERRMHLASALLTAGGALALGYVYRDFLFKKRSQGAGMLKSAGFIGMK